MSVVVGFMGVARIMYVWGIQDSVEIMVGFVRLSVVSLLPRQGRRGCGHAPALPLWSLFLLLRCPVGPCHVFMPDVEARVHVVPIAIEICLSVFLLLSVHLARPLFLSLSLPLLPITSSSLFPSPPLVHVINVVS